INVAGRNDAGIVLAPLGRGSDLSRALVRLPATAAILRVEAEVAVLHQERGARGGRIIVVVVKDIAERGDRLFVRVAEIETDRLDVRAVGIHAERRAADVHVAIVALLTRVIRRTLFIHWNAAAALGRVVMAAVAEGAAGFVRDERAGI